MKVERWEDETDEDWDERLAEEIELANATETTQYFVERDQYVEENFIINYIGETGWTWKEHPEGPFSCKQVLEWKKKAETLDELQKTLPSEELLEKMSGYRLAVDKLEAIKTFAEAMVPSYMSQRILDILQSSDTTARDEK